MVYNVLNEMDRTARKVAASFVEVPRAYAAVVILGSTFNARDLEHPFLADDRRSGRDRLHGASERLGRLVGGVFASRGRGKQAAAASPEASEARPEA